MKPAWSCLAPDCDAGDDDDSWARVDKAAALHTKTTQHPTTTRTVGSERRRTPDGRTVNRTPKETP